MAGKKTPTDVKYPNADAARIAANIDALHQSGHNYLDVPAQVAIAYGATDTSHALNMANVLQQSLVPNIKPTLTHIFSDPQLQKVPSITQQISYWIHGSMGGLPIAEANIAKIQQDMISKGQAPSTAATATGVWDAEWQNAFSNAAINALQQPGVGNFDAKDTVKKLLNQGLLSTALNSVYATVKSMPRSVMQLMGDVVNASLKNPITMKPTETGAKIGEAIANAQIWPGKPVQQQTTQEFTNSASDRALQDMGTLLSFIPIGKLAFGTKAAIGEAAAKGALKPVPFAEVAPKFTILKSIQNSAAAGTESVLPKVFPRVVANNPVMGWMYRGLTAGIAKTAPAQMTVRNAFAQRLRLPIVQATNQIINKTIVTGALETGIAAVESKGPVDTPLDNTLYSLHPISGNLANALDILAMQANPGGRSQAAIQSYKTDVKNGANVLREALDETGVLMAWQKANPDMNLADLIAAHGAAPVYQHITDQLNQIAVRHGADLVINPMKAEGITGKWATMDDVERMDLLNQVAHDIWTNSADKNSALAQARESIILDQNALENGFRSLRVETKAGVKAGRMGQKAAGESSFNNFVQAREIATKMLEPDAQKYLIHPGTIQEFNLTRVPKTEVTQPLPGTKLRPADIKGKFTEENILKQFPNAQKFGSGKYEKWYVPTQGPSELKTTELAPWETLTPAQEAAKATKLDRGWVEMNNPELGRGAFGLARVDSLSKQEALTEIGKLTEALSKAKSVEETDAVRIQAAKFLVDNFGIDTRAIGYKTADQMLEIATAQAKRLAVDIYPVANAPKVVQGMFADLKKLGYKPVAGTDIGHYFTKDLVTGVELGNAQRKATAQIAAKFGLSPRLSDASSISARTAIETNIEIQKVLDEGLRTGKVVVPPGYNASRVISWLRKGLDEDRNLSAAQKLILSTSMSGKKGGTYAQEIQDLMAAGKTRIEAEAAVIKVKQSEMGFRDATKKQLLDALTRPMDDISADLLGVPKGTPFMDTESANEIIKAIWRARIKVPSEMIGGLAKMEDLLYSGMGVAGNEIKIAGKTLNGATIPNIPAYLLGWRNRWRFQYSLTFAYRRIFKTMAKGITEGVPPTFYPAAKMRSMGIWNKADALYKEMYPKENIKNLFLDDVERLTNQADLWNLFSPRDFTRWNLYWLHQQGYRGQELLDKVEHVMGYGQRTAAERSLNAVFYPFSFNKTVMRQFGGYLLTHPGQRMIMSGLIYAYDNIDWNGHTGQQWKKIIDDNMPLIKQLEKLNALEHGVGLGGFGGINMPYAQPLFSHFATLLGPKQISFGTANQNKNTIDTLAQYIPLLKTAQELLQQVPDTAKTGASLALRTFGAYAAGSDVNPTPQKLMPAKAQQNAAWEYRARLITGLQQVLDYNYKHPNSPIPWSAITPNIPTATGLLDQPINKFTIGELVNYRYPAWDNTIASSAGAAKRTEADRFIGEVTDINPTLGALYRKVDDYAVKVSDLVSRDNIDMNSLRQITSKFREAAIELSISDNNFYKFYKTHYQRIFGPLEGFSK